ncbi:MAG: GntR family transcriptional regulator [Alphaproteobacteria bacterium]|nr:MAG: GntR family transcriptional regulator [Alphaproteobacteria bacterium]
MDDRDDKLRRQPAGTTEHEAILQALREMILFGDLAPGEAVTVAGLAARCQAGTMPVREAVRRLDSEGALERMGNRRVRVPPMTGARLGQIRLARAAIEPELARRAVERAQAQGRESTLAAELKRLDTQLDLAIESGDIRGYLRFNFKFHFGLYGAAEAEVLERIALSLWLQVAPSLRIMCGRYGTGNLPDLHEQVIAAARAGDAEDAARAVAEDIAQGMDGVAVLLQSGFDQNN